MITEQGIVTYCRDHLVEVALQRQSACGRCEISQGCGTGALGRLLGHRNKPLLIETDTALQPGDQVEIRMPEKALVRASLIVYGLPLSGMVVAGLLASLLFTDELVLALLSLLGFTGGYLLARFLGNRLVSGYFTPHLVKIGVNPESVSES